jgi:hypothetical protein
MTRFVTTTAVGLATALAFSSAALANGHRHGYSAAHSSHRAAHGDRAQLRYAFNLSIPSDGGVASEPLSNFGVVSSGSAYVFSSELAAAARPRRALDYRVSTAR